MFSIEKIADLIAPRVGEGIARLQTAFDEIAQHMRVQNENTVYLGNELREIRVELAGLAQSIKLLAALAAPAEVPPAEAAEATAPPVGGGLPLTATNGAAGPV